MLLIGTRDGLYRADAIPFDGVSPVLDLGAVTALRRTKDGDLIAVVGGNCYRSVDGKEWNRLGVTADRVTTVGTGPGGKLYAGTDPSRLYRSTDGGDTWSELTGFRSIPSRDTRETRGGGDHVSAVRVHSDTPGRLVAAVAPAGVYLSDDGGDTWVERRFGLHDDVHDLLVWTPQAFLAATGDGFYRTGDAGRTWIRVDTHHTYFQYSYFQSVAIYDGRWYAAAVDGAPGTWADAPDAALFESGDGDRFERVLLPTDGEFPVAFARYDGHVIAGTLAHDIDRPSTRPAHVLYRADGTWEIAGATPAGVWALCSR